LQLLYGMVRGRQRCLVAAALASARKAELSARAIAVGLTLERFQGWDDPVQVGLDAAQVLGEALLSFAVGLGDERAVRFCLPPVDLQEHGRGLEVRAGQAGVRVRQSCCAGRPQ
jgi:hypothetical protein